MKNRILVVEDEEAIADLVSMNLMVAGYDVETASDGIEAEEKVKSGIPFDLAVLDVMLPGKDGFALMPLMQEYQIPVIFLTAKDDVISKITGLKKGAEDYIVKPFEVLELLVRIEKVLERRGRMNQELQVADITIDLHRRIVKREENEIHLKPLEYEVLVLMAKNKNVTFTRERLLKEVWGSDYFGETRTVDVHIGQLRKKLGFSQVIQTIPKIGYRLED